MNIRSATPEDIESLTKVYDAARKFMQSTGNKKQWVDGYPSKELILRTIHEGGCYVCVSDKMQIAGAFYFKVEEDPSYAKIYDGQWLNDKPYGVVHRIASGGQCKGIGDFCLEWCFRQCGNIKIDTHADNMVMQNILRKNGYTKCGTIFVANGTPRVAFQKE